MSSDKEAKLKSLQLTLDKLDKTYGKGTVMKLGDNSIVESEVISSNVTRYCRSSKSGRYCSLY